MTVTRNLSAEEFGTFFSPGMEDVTSTADAVVDIWPYVDSIPADDLGEVVPHDVHYVFRATDGGRDHIVIKTSIENLELVIVIDRQLSAIVGHHLLNLNALYGLSN